MNNDVLIPIETYNTIVKRLRVCSLEEFRMQTGLKPKYPIVYRNNEEYFFGFEIDDGKQYMFFVLKNGAIT